MGTCNTNGVIIPPSLIEECSGKYTSSKCTLHPNALTEFSLPADSSVFDIIEAYKSAIISLTQRITDLENA
jgi:hypothetical protein